MEWGIIAIGAVFVVYLLYCLIRDRLSDRRFKSFVRKSREKTKTERGEKKQD
jgi:hypothetical protein